MRHIMPAGKDVEGYANNIDVLRAHYSDVFCSRRTQSSSFSCHYNEYKATVDIRTCELLDGDLPKKQTKLVLAWAELHQEELMANWKLVMNGEEPFKIQPLQ